MTKEGAARPGRIPGAVGIFWEENRLAAGPYKGCWKSAAELKELYTSRGITPDKDIYIYGHTDLSASYTLVSLYLAGYPLEKLQGLRRGLDRLEPQPGTGGHRPGQVKDGLPLAAIPISNQAHLGPAVRTP